MLLGRFCFMTRNKYVTFPDKTENISLAKILHTPWSMSRYSWVTAYIFTLFSNEGKNCHHCWRNDGTKWAIWRCRRPGYSFSVGNQRVLLPVKSSVADKEAKFVPWAFKWAQHAQVVSDCKRRFTPCFILKPEKTLIEFCSCFRPEPDPDPRMLLQGGDLQDIKEPNVVLAFGW